MSTVTITGIALHVAFTIGWGVLFAVVAARVRGWWLLVASAAVALVAWMVASGLLLRQAGPGAAEVLGPGQLAGLHLVLAVALAIGMRFARSAIRNDTARHAVGREEP